MNRLSAVSLGFLIAVTICSSACEKAIGITKPSINEFKELPKGKFNLTYGYEALNQASSLQQVIAKFGNPSKSEDFSSLLAGNGQILYYEAKDEYGNKCHAALKFFNACRGGNAKPECLVLVDVGTAQLPN
jgi:hypothetical protein